MANATAVQAVLDERWTDIDYEDRMVAIACFTVDAEDGGWWRRKLGECEGVLVDAAWTQLRVAVFLRMVDAVGFAHHLRDRLDGRCRIGVNLAEFEVSGDGRPGEGVLYAAQLMEQSEPGGMTISAVAGQKVTTRLGAGEDGRDTATGWRGLLYLSLQVGGLLGYFAAWMYGFYWVISYYVEHKVYPCWPEFMCG